MIDRNSLTSRRLAVAAAALLGVALAAGVMILWSWNTVAVDLFRAPPAQFRHAVAVEIFLAAVTGICLLATRLGGGR
jgi:hypothetical protein